MDKLSQSVKDSLPANTQELSTAPSQKEREDMARRRFQRGSLILRGKRNPVWVARWRVDVVGPDGKVERRRPTEVLGTKRQFPTQKLALRELERRLAPVNDPSYRAKREDTFEQFVEFWKAHVLSKRKPSTQYSIKSQLKNHLVPRFGKMKLQDIHWRDLQEFVTDCTLAPKSCRNLILSFQMVWKSAKAADYVTHDPLNDLALPSSPPPKPFFYTAEEAKAIIREAEGQFKTAFWLAAETGVRPGELCALKIEDLDLERGIIHVRRSVWRTIFITPKTANAIRDLAISDNLTEHLQVYLKTWKPNADNLLFISKCGGPLHPCSVRRDVLIPICTKLGIQAKGLKAFRHCSATMMDQAGVPMKVRQERLGHAPGTKVTMVHYTHSVAGDARMAATAVGSMLVQ